MAVMQTAQNDALRLIIGNKTQPFVWGHDKNNDDVYILTLRLALALAFRSSSSSSWRCSTALSKPVTRQADVRQL